MGGWGKEAANLPSQPPSSLESDSVLAGHPGGAWAGRREDLETLIKEYKALASVSLDEEAGVNPREWYPFIMHTHLSPAGQYQLTLGS